VFAQRTLDDYEIRNASPDMRDILHEQFELRQELKGLERESRQIELRLISLDRLAEVQRELDRAIEQLERAESSDDEERAARLEARLEPLERHLDHLREQLEVEGELDQRIDEVNELVHQLRVIEGIDKTPRWARHLAKRVDSLCEMREIRATLNTLDPEDETSIRDRLQQQADDLQERTEADEEFVELIFKLFEALEDDHEEDIEDLLPEISELLDELEDPREASVENPSANHAAIDQLRLVSGEYFIMQSWSQEKRFRRPYYVSSPKPQANEQKLPVFIFLHGNGGNAKEAMIGFGRQRKTLASRCIMVFPQGYRESWNIVSERSKADDREFIEAIVLDIAKFDNVDPINFTIMGASNGAAMVNQLAIESSLPNVRTYITGVSPLNVWQYSGEHFKAKGEDNNYRVAVTPARGKRLMNISGVRDELVPYDGGPSKAIPAKDGKLAFVAAEESTFIWARHMGYVGEQLTGPTRTSGDVQIFSYLNGDVVHYKVNNEGHGAMHGISEVMLLDFLQGGENSGQK
jgi:poly(3-hydroxybutyrate) depolymerase